MTNLDPSLQNIVNLVRETRAELDADPCPAGKEERERWEQRRKNRVDKQFEEIQNKYRVVGTFIPKPRKVGRKVDWSATFAAWEKIKAEVPMTLEELASILDGYEYQTVRKEHAKYQNFES